MPEPVTTIGIGAIAAYLGKDGLQKLLGPTADYLGTGLKGFTQRRTDTIARIFSNASEKLGSKIDIEGTVPPKVLKQIVDAGSFADDAVETDYLGGVLASSRSSTLRDNRGASIAKQIDSLSNYQLRAHYLVYASIKNVFAHHNIPFNMDGRPKLTVFLPYADFCQAMDYADEELLNQMLLPHIFFGLNKDGLCAEFQFGPAETLQETMAPQANAPGIAVQPSATGAELFLWAFGKGSEDLSFIFDSSFIPVIDSIPFGVPGALAAKIID